MPTPPGIAKNISNPFRQRTGTLIRVSGRCARQNGRLADDLAKTSVVHAALALCVAELDRAGDRPWLRYYPEVLHRTRIRNGQIASTVCRAIVWVIAWS